MDRVLHPDSLTCYLHEYLAKLVSHFNCGDNQSGSPLLPCPALMATHLVGYLGWPIQACASHAYKSIWFPWSVCYGGLSDDVSLQTTKALRRISFPSTDTTYPGTHLGSSAPVTYCWKCANITVPSGSPHQNMCFDRDLVRELLNTLCTTKPQWGWCI